MTQRDLSGWLSNLLGPVEIQDDGATITARGKINFKGGLATDNPANNSIDIEVEVPEATPPGGSSGSVQINDGGAFAGVAPGTSGNVLTSNGSAWTSSPASGGAEPAGDDGEIQIKDGTDLAAATNVKAGSNFCSIGAAPSTSGYLRLDGAADATFVSLKYSDTNDYAALALASGIIVLGNSTLGTRINGGANITLFSAGGIGLFNTSGTAFAWEIGASSNLSTQPILGGTDSPYGVHGQAIIALTVDKALVSSEYTKHIQRFTGTGSYTVTYPAPESDAAAYTKIVDNQTTGDLTVSTGGSGTVVLAAGVSALLIFDNTVGVRLAVTGA